MKFIPHYLFAKNLDSNILRENFLISAAISIIIIRLFLKFTNYPIIGGDSLHIAHMIWGGFFMVGAFFLLFSFISKKMTILASILGGIGFGVFIDELGKFITKDNNYFFEPTLALIYMIFVVLFMLSHVLARYEKVPKEVYLLNALESLKEAVVNDMDVEEKKLTKYYLEKSDKNHPLTQAISHYLQTLEQLPEKSPTFYSKVRSEILLTIRTISRSQFLGKVVGLIIFLQAIFVLFLTLNTQIFTVDSYGKVISSIVVLTLSAIGFFYINRSRKTAYRLFKNSIFVSIFFTQFFLLYSFELVSFLILPINIFLLLVVDGVILDEEKQSVYRDEK